MATISEVQICNMALSNVGAKSTIESLTEDSTEAKECNLWYHYSRLQTLETFDWNFARRRLTLATHGDDPPDAWAYRYQYPVDCVSLRKLQNPAGEKKDPIPFVIEASDDLDTKSILTNLDDAVGVYTFNLKMVTLFSAFFVEMLSFALASHLSYTITGKLEIRKEMIITFSALQRVAPAFNAGEQVATSPRDAPWIENR